MEPRVLETNFLDLAIIDKFESFIWTDKYCGYGDFELLLAVNSRFVNYIFGNRYLSLKESEHLMIIETLNIKSDIENGNRVIVKGRSIESILERRIVWDQTILTGNLQNGIELLLNENAINPDDPARAISNLIFEASTDPAITSLNVDRQFTGDNLYKAILDLCQSKNIGFKITLNGAGQFVFKLYSGVNRSYDQIENPYVVFSRKFDNVLKGDYLESNVSLKTVTLVAGEVGVANERKKVIVEAPEGAGSGLARREMFSDARNITSNTPSGVLTDEEYEYQLAQKGSEDLAKNTFIKMFEGDVDVSRMYVYGKDFFMGDILQITDDYGHETKSQVTALINSESTSGINTYPTFTTVA